MYIIHSTRQIQIPILIKKTGCQHLVYNSLAPIFCCLLKRLAFPDEIFRDGVCWHGHQQALPVVEGGDAQLAHCILYTLGRRYGFVENFTTLNLVESVQLPCSEHLEQFQRVRFEKAQLP